MEIRFSCSVAMTVFGKFWGESLDGACAWQDGCHEYSA